MKKTIKGLIVCGLLSFLAFNGFGEEKAEGLKIWADLGQHQGDVCFQESVTGYSSSLIEFEADGIYLSLGARYQFVQTAAPKLSLSVCWQAARDEYEGGMQDSDWFAPMLNTLAIYSESDADTTQDLYDINFGYQILEASGEKFKLDALVGFYKTNYEIDYFNVNTQIYYYQGINDINFGDAGSYNAEMRGYYLGLAGSFWPNEKFGIDASVKYIPNLDGDSKAEWELRDLMFKQRADGDGMVASLGLTVIPKEHWYFGLQVTMTDLDVTNGNVQNYFWNYDQDVWSPWGTNDLDYVEIKSLQTALRVGFKF